MAAPAQMFTRVALTFRANGVADMDTFSKSDPYLQLWDTTTGTGRGICLGRTETIDNNLNPVWAKSFVVDYHFETRQAFRADLFDDDGPDETPDALGSVLFTLGEVMGARAHTCAKPIPLRGGTLTIVATEVSSQLSHDVVALTVSARQLPTVGLFGSVGDYYYRIWHTKANGLKVKVHRSNPTKGTRDPKWPRFGPVPAIDLVAGQHATGLKNLRLEVFSAGIIGKDPVGSFDFTYDDITRAAATPASANGPAGTSAPFRLSGGGDVFLHAMVQHRPSFTEYLALGLQLNLNVAIDFTGSNGDPRTPQSLHFMNPSQPNQYAQAIMSVGDVLIDYDADKMVPLVGFGAKLPNGQVSHCFNVNMQPQPFVHGIQGVLDAYGRCLPTLQLYGPTNFAPIIRYVTNAARSLPHVYSVLLILTDGDITDMDDTVAAIVAADTAPLSIIIVGVGSGCDFQLMDQLDGDEVRLSHNGRVAKRDLVQFVPFRDYATKPRAALAAAVLEELPRQVEEWADLVRYQPPAAAAAPAVAAAGTVVAATAAAV
jgi:hypothetical protein